MMSELSIAQKQYILSQKKHRRTVRIGRSSICILFLLLWEFTADAGIIDSFVFSSPSKIVTFLRLLSVLHLFSFFHYYLQSYCGAAENYRKL